MTHDRTKVRAEIAPSGEIRAAINLGNAALAQRDEATGELGGVSVALARELGRDLDCPVRLMPYSGAGKVFAAVETDAWDLAFLAIDPKRAEVLSFSPPYAVIASSYVVPEASPFRAVEEVDTPGTRIAVARNAAYDLYLAKHRKAAEIIHADTPGASLEMFKRDGLDAAAGVIQVLQRFVAENPGYRLLPGGFATIRQAMAMPHGRSAAAAYVADFIEARKASGFVRVALDESGRSEVALAP